MWERSWEVERKKSINELTNQMQAGRCYYMMRNPSYAIILHCLVFFSCCRGEGGGVGALKSGTAPVGLLDFSLRYFFFFARLFVFDFSNVSHISHKPN